jgi:hypothetical protein
VAGSTRKIKGEIFKELIKVSGGGIEAKTCC